MLDGNIQIFDDLRLVCQHVNQLFGHLVRIEIMHTHPDKAVDGAELLQQLRQLPLAVQIDAVAARVLRNDDQLLDAAVRQILRFF